MSTRASSVTRSNSAERKFDEEEKGSVDAGREKRGSPTFPPQPGKDDDRHATELPESNDLRTKETTLIKKRWWLKTLAARLLPAGQQQQQEKQQEEAMSPSTQPAAAAAAPPPAAADQHPTSSKPSDSASASAPTGDAKAAGGAANGGDAEPTAQDEESLLGPEDAELVDRDVFDQLLEIDDDDTREFSKGLAFDYIHQADATIEEIKTALTDKDLATLSARGHFLKGSSAALGFQRVQHSCEALQHFGKRLDAHGEGPECDDDEALKRCRILMGRLVREQKDAREWLESFYQDKA
ncbi:hypothetical protein JCM8202_002809 [Rhodotorula sphaerocarpa]